jgi:hypothetical protein
LSMFFYDRHESLSDPPAHRREPLGHLSHLRHHARDVLRRKFPRGKARDLPESVLERLGVVLRDRRPPAGQVEAVARRVEGLAERREALRGRPVPGRVAARLSAELTARRRRGRGHGRAAGAGRNLCRNSWSPSSRPARRGTTGSFRHAPLAATSRRGSVSTRARRDVLPGVRSATPPAPNRGILPHLSAAKSTRSYARSPAWGLLEHLREPVRGFAADDDPKRGESIGARVKS